MYIIKNINLENINLKNISLKISPFTKKISLLKSALLLTITLITIITLNLLIIQNSYSHSKRVYNANKNSNKNSSQISSLANIDAKAWLIMDSQTQTILASHNANKRLPPASITKLMTAYVIGTLIKQKKLSFYTKIKISKTAARTEGSKMVLRPGQKVKVISLLKGLLINSGNDAAVALAQGSVKNERQFIYLMNQYSKKLGLKNTHFNNPNGLPAKNHYSSAKDLAILANALINEMPTIYKLCSNKTISWNKRTRLNTNKLLGGSLKVDGVKTGYTKKAQFCFVASAKQKNQRLITVVLGAKSVSQRFNIAKKLLRYGFRNFITKTFYTKNKTVKNIAIKNSKNKTISLAIVPKYNLTLSLPNKAIKTVKCKTKLSKNLKSLQLLYNSNQNIKSVGSLVCQYKKKYTDK